MIDCSGIFYAEGAGHDLKLSEGMVNVKPQDPIGSPSAMLLNHTPLKPLSYII